MMSRSGPDESSPKRMRTAESRAPSSMERNRDISSGRIRAAASATGCSQPGSSGSAARSAPDRGRPEVSLPSATVTFPSASSATTVPSPGSIPHVAMIRPGLNDTSRRGLIGELARRTKQLASLHRIRGSLAERGAPVGNRARPTRRPARMADAPAMPDHPVREHRPLRPRKEGAHLLLDLDRVVFLRPPESAGQPAEVGVDGDSRYAERVAEYDVCRLAADPGERDKIL